MVSSGALSAGNSWLHGDVLETRPLLSTLRSIIDYSNLFFVFVFYLLLLITRKSSHGGTRRDWLSIGISGCCALISIGYYGTVAYVFVTEGKEFSHLKWMILFSRGIIWTTLSISVIVRGSKWVSVMKSAWWIVFFLLISALNIVNLANLHLIHILEFAHWLASFLLFFYALRNVHGFLSQPEVDNSFVESLLIEESEKNRGRLGESTFLSKLFFSWMNPLFKLGNSKTLTLEDIPPLGYVDEALLAYRKFEDAWSKIEGESDSRNLVFWALAKIYWKNMMLAGIFALLRSVSVVSSSLLLYAFVSYSNLETKNLMKGVSLVGFLVVLKVLESLSYRQFFFYSRRLGMRMRSALMAAVYSKQLKISSLGRQRHSTGEVVNYISVDAYRMGEFVMWFHVGWTSVVQIFLSIAVLYIFVGVGVLPGLVPLLISGLLNVPFARIVQRYQTEFMIVQDERLRSLSEILNNIKIIKLQSWEEKFKNLNESLRKSEFKWLTEIQFLKTYNVVLYWMSPTVVSSVIFFGCVLFKSSPFDAGMVFTVMAALRTMSEPFRFIPEALSFLIQVKVSLARINSFLLEDELKEEDVVMHPTQDSDHIIKILGGYFSWDAESAVPTLKDIEMEVKEREKIAICGPVGGGKSSLLHAILGEIHKISGNVSVVGSVAYVSQASWIQSGTIPGNILFGKVMEKAKYEEAIRVCSLDKDIESFDYGDLTEIGQRGLNLSGGQKQRVQLARAVYNDADIYLLDDPFSAVDAHTAASLFNDCVMTALAKKTVVLVTHQVDFLKNVDRILVVAGGQITQSGNYQELLISGTTFDQLVSSRETNALSSGLNKHEPRVKLDDKTNEEEEREGDIIVSSRNQLTEEEEKEVGEIGWQSILDYISISKGFVFACSCTAAQCSFVAFQAAASFWLAISVSKPDQNSLLVIGIYTMISLLSTVFVYLRSLFAVLLGLKASKAFFHGFTNSIFNAPMLFFDSTPVGRILTRVRKTSVGRILTRASSDLSLLDFEMPTTLGLVMFATTEILAAIGIMAYVVWQVFFVGIFALVSSYYVQRYYQRSADQLMRINGTTKAPVMNYASESALGAATVRVFRVTNKFFSRYLELVDADARVFLSSNAAMEWLTLRSESLQNLTVFTAAICLVFFPSNHVSAGLVGLCLSYAFALTGIQVFFSRFYSSLANYIVSVERIKQYMKVPPQPPSVIADNRPPVSWPHEGRIQLLDLKIRYRPNSPLVLKGITCTFREGTRVGVVGRTGSGKTTLISALFRLVEPHGGRILVDGVDISSVGLKDLRMKLSIIPQEPTLFRGSVRTNLDPLGLHSDAEIWEALEKCQLKSTISKLPNLLESSVSDEGENWSMGQRQLFCLGRVLLRRNKILVLDEATASIDSNTDAILQRIIREEFAECTVITVAHRVSTVIDSDMVLVLSYGKVVEYEEPSKLMETNSAFSKLVAEYWPSCNRN